MLLGCDMHCGRESKVELPRDLTWPWCCCRSGLAFKMNKKQFYKDVLAGMCLRGVRAQYGAGEACDFCAVDSVVLQDNLRKLDEVRQTTFTVFFGRVGVLWKETLRSQIQTLIDVPDLLFGLIILAFAFRCSHFMPSVSDVH